MAKPDGKKLPLLKQYWEVDYGMSIKWDDLFDCKMSGYARGGDKGPRYVLLAWKESGGICVADVAWNGLAWDMQNDGSDLLTEDEWKRVYIPADCDWWRIREVA
jgi:hypothetical protein